LLLTSLTYRSPIGVGASSSTCPSPSSVTSQSSSFSVRS
jgi:hypothetical protein